MEELGRECGNDAHRFFHGVNCLDPVDRWAGDDPDCPQASSANAVVVFDSRILSNDVRIRADRQRLYRGTWDDRAGCVVAVLRQCFKARVCLVASVVFERCSSSIGTGVF